MKLMKILSALVLTGTILSTAKATDVTGAGSSFVYPVLSKWAEAYKKETGSSINYQSIGSGGGIKQIQANTVDFGATDMPLKSEDLAKNGLIQFPVINGAIVPIINIEGVKDAQLKLDGKVLAGIFLGNIKKWNDPAIAALNTGLKLPNTEITTVHRSDGSGSTFIWSNYLSKINDEWKTKVGEGSAVNWPAGVGGKGNEGVASNVKQINGSIGYVEYAYALQNKLATVQMKNKDGQFVKAESKTFKEAAAKADWSGSKDFYLILTDAAGKNSWPIVGSTFVLMHKNAEKIEQVKESLKFFKWVYSKGSNLAEELHYVPLPLSVSSMVEKAWKNEIKNKDGAPVANF